MLKNAAIVPPVYPGIHFVIFLKLFLHYNTAFLVLSNHFQTVHQSLVLKHPKTIVFLPEVLLTSQNSPYQDTLLWYHISIWHIS